MKFFLIFAAAFFFTTGALAANSENDDGHEIIGEFPPPGAIVDFAWEDALMNCSHKVEIDGIVYDDFLDLFLIDIFEEFGAYPPGLTFETVILDSTLYIVKAGICFQENERFGIPENMELIRVPLGVIFPGANPDTVRADFLSAGTLLWQNSSEGIFKPLEIRNGRLCRFYRTAEEKEADRATYLALNAEDTNKANNQAAANFKDPRFVSLMERLKPYYGEKLWKRARKYCGWK